ncbi:MAG: alpha-amylase family glycosyl hydrolase [Chloroflexota bacterium]
MTRQFVVRMLVVLTLSVLAGSPMSAQEPATIDRAALLHDTHDDLYRTPGGAVPLGANVTLRLRAATGNLDSATVRVFRTLDNTQNLVPMQVVASTPEGYDFWEATITLPDQPTVVYYRFLLTKGSETLFYEENTYRDGNYFEAAEGGPGAVYEQSQDLSFQISVYDPDFTTPEWMQNAVIYQIFPDRFRNGDRSNDPVDGSFVFYDELPLIFHETWNEPPVDGRREKAPSGADYFNSDFFGGDLAGIIEKLDYLAGLGVTAIYLNPIFEARSNHRYDTVDYLKIDPLLGDLETFRRLVQEADKRGIRLILDGVFNHMSSDSPFFDRYNRFLTTGACESTTSPWRRWFFFVPPREGQPSPCVNTLNGARYYTSWAGFDTIPKINSELGEVRRYFFLDQNSVALTWGAEGIGGWRLDVANEIDGGRNPAETYWEAFRNIVKRQNLDTIIIGEYWNDASEWLLGDEWDSVMNYRFRRAILGFARGTDYTDNDGLIWGLTPSEFIDAIRAVEEDYPRPAYLALMNLAGSHDTSRLLYVVDGDIRRQQLAALAQFTLPGAPTIYYGDEIALDAPSLPDPNGVVQDDPYNRAPYPWEDTEGDHYPPPNEAMLAFYQTLGTLRNRNSALRTGDLIPLAADDDQGILAYLRTDRDTGDIALVAFNVSDEPRDVVLNLDGLVPANTELRPVFAGATLTAAGDVELALPPLSGNIWEGNAGSDGYLSPEPPATVETTAQPGSVTISWQPVANAAGYTIYRSPVSTGGFERITEEPFVETSFTDHAVVNGYVYYYAVAAVNEDGIAGERSAAVAALPSAQIDAAYFVDAAGERIAAQPETIVVQFVSGVSVPVSAAIEIDDVTGQPGPAPGVRAQAALLPPGQSLNDAQWTAMSYSEDVGQADVYRASVVPPATGEYEIHARFSTDAGQNWTIVAPPQGSPLRVVVEATTDTTAPDAPASVEIIRASLSGVVLTWSPSEAEDVFSYRVYRVAEDGSTQQIGEVQAAAGERFVDPAVVAGDRYRYGVSAVDSSLNESEIRLSDAAVVEAQRVPVVFDVEVPTGTEGDVYIAGDFGTTDLPVWDPGGLVMIQVDETHWTITLDLPEGANIEYKYVRGDWLYVEKGPACEEIANRRLAVVYGDDDRVSTSDTVANWRDVCEA